MEFIIDGYTFDYKGNSLIQTSWPSGTPIKRSLQATPLNLDDAKRTANRFISLYQAYPDLYHVPFAERRDRRTSNIIHLPLQQQLTQAP